ncbi:MAG: nucleotide exchange factor GrpE [Desulfovibrio sp.]|nr:nucleotide exchange factor GrpE [Desulfovibrio sp.]
MSHHYRNPYEREARAQQAAHEAAQREKEQKTKEEGFGNAFDEEESIPVHIDTAPEEPAVHEDDAVQAEVKGAEEERDPSLEEPLDAFQGEANYEGPLFSSAEAKAAHQEVEALKAELENLRLRQAAEMENFKKRLAREHQEQLQYAAGTVLSDLLPTLDNLELAMQYGTTSDVCKDLLQGVSMTHKLLLDAVQKHGLVPVGEVGEPFDPQIHEAVGFDPNTELEAGKVARVLQKGYKLGNRLVRAARVMISQ